MKTLTVGAEVAPDGSLHLTVPSGLPPGRVEVVLVIQAKVQNGEAVELTSQPGQLWAAERERLQRIGELLDMALAGVDWAEVEEGRRDRDIDDLSFA
jgi:hypothetical protein